MRRGLFTTAAAGLLATAVAAPALAGKEKEACEKCEACKSPVLGQKAKTIDGKEVHLAKKYAGKVLLVVNVASKCGYTPQYEGLQNLHEKYADEGLAVLGFPCNQFGNQEPGDEEQIKKFCKSNYGVQFDMFSKIEVNGDSAHPLYKYLTSDELPVEPKGKIQWNFEKFLVDRSGKVVARYRSEVKPSSKKIVSAIERELKKDAPAN